MTSGQSQTAPRALRYVRVLVAIEVTRLFGLILFSGIQSGLIQTSAALFGVGDALVGITAIPVAYLLGRGGMRKYTIAVAWATFGLVDLVYAVIDGALSGQFAALSALLGPGLIAIPFNIVVQVITLGLLLTTPVARYMARSAVT